MPNPSTPETQLVAGPPAANPPLAIALVLTGLSLASPIIFLKAGAPSPLFGVAVAALAAAGMITMVAAANAQRRRRADAAIRPRASITRSGLTLRPGPTPGAEQYFAAAEIRSAHLLPRALIIHTVDDHPKPGRYVLRFGKLVTSRDILNSALSGLLEQD